MAEGQIDLGPASSNPDAAPVSDDRNRAYRAGAGRAQGRWHSRSTVSTRDASLCLVAWCGHLNDIRGFPDAAFYPQLAKSSAKLVVMHSVQDGQADRREAPAGDIMDHIAFFDARIAALTGAGIKRNRLVLDPGMGFFWGCSRNLALGAGAVR
ncbi:dihydropteroate synthase [Salmonella enterica]|uniref:dihydropteroate synthase n=1 Tax=Salmonella enterica TaxID=28901 RepID=UPI00159E6604